MRLLLLSMLFERNAADDKPVLPSLIDIEKLLYGKKNAGPEERLAGPRNPGLETRFQPAGFPLCFFGIVHLSCCVS